MKFAISTDSSFHKCFICHTQYCLIAFYRDRILLFLILESVPSDIVAALLPKFMYCFKSFVFILTFFTRSRFHLKNPFLCLFIRSNFLSIQVVSWDCSNSVTSSGSTSNSNSLAISITSEMTYSIEVLNPSMSSIRVGNNFFQTPVNVGILNSSRKSWMFLMTSRMMKPFQKIFNLLLPRRTGSIRAITI